VSGFVNSQGLLKVVIGSGADRVTGFGIVDYGAVVTNVNDAVGFVGYFLTKTNSQAFKLGP